MASSQHQKEKRELHRKRTTLFQEKDDAAHNCKICSRHSGCEVSTESCGSCSAYKQLANASESLEAFLKETKKVNELVEGNQALTKIVYEIMRKEGKKDSEIAKDFGITQPSLAYRKKKWFKEEQAEIRKEVKQPKEQEYKNLLNALQNKITDLEKAEQASQEKINAWKNQYDSICGSLQHAEEKIRQLEMACDDWESENKLLQNKNTELTSENSTLHEQLDLKIKESESYYGGLLKLQTDLNKIQSESKNHKQISILLAKEYVRRNEVELNA